MSVCRVSCSDLVQCRLFFRDQTFAEKSEKLLFAKAPIPGPIAHVDDVVNEVALLRRAKRQTDFGDDGAELGRLRGWFTTIMA